MKCSCVNRRGADLSLRVPAAVKDASILLLQAQVLLEPSVCWVVDQERRGGGGGGHPGELLSSVS